MKVLITGADGQLGYHLQQAFAEHELYLGDLRNYDITNAELIMKETLAFQPDLIIHAAAYTNVDKAEVDKDLCWKINVDGSRNVAEAAKAVDAPIVAISTDYVFAGDKGSSYLETDTPAPLSYYGQTKYEGEKAVMAAAPKHFICRTSWLYGGTKPTSDMDFTASGRPKNFVLTMLRVGKDKSEIEVVSDQVGGPTYAQDLANHIALLAATKQYGIYHLTNSGVTNWADFAEAIFATAIYNTTVNHITSEVYAEKNPAATKRPKYSVLGHDHLLEIGLPDLRSWQDALADYLSEWK